MKRSLLVLGAFTAMNGTLMAGGDLGKTVEPVVPVVPVVSEDDHSGFYLGGAAIYNRTYGLDSGWFDDSTRTQDETWGLTGIIGYDINEYLAVEGRYTKTMGERDYADVTIWSIFLKPQYRFQSEDKTVDDGYFTVYGLIGFGNNNVEGSSGDNTYSAHPAWIGRDIMDETGFQWGVGASYTFVDIDNGVRKDTWTIFVDYTMTANDADINAPLYNYDPNTYNELSTDGVSVGVIYHF